MDAKNIKNSLNFIAQYISNKQVDSVRSNNLEDLKDIGGAVWNFISSVYQANWDSLHANNQSNSLQKLPPLLEKTKRKSISLSQPTSKGSLCPFQLNLRKRLMLSFSRATSRQPILSNLLNLTPKSLSKIPILWKSSRLKKYSLPLVQRKSTKSITLLRVLQRQNLIFK